MTEPSASTESGTPSQRPPAQHAERSRWSGAGAAVRWPLSYRTTIGYAALLAAGSVALSAHDQAGQLVWLRWASTNVSNLQHRPVSVLVLSAFLPDGHATVWVVLSVVGLGCTERVLGSLRTAALVAGGHLVGTAVSEGILGYRVQVGQLSAQYRHIIDVGPSFVVVTGLAAALVLGGLWPRIIAGGCLLALAPSLLDGLTNLDVAAVGHLCAAATGVVGGGLLGRRRRTSRPESAGAG